ncbi:MAG TPA: tail fiber domain-containing protein, partial [Bacteroidia bacterium]|nr:tail fiber domain-containing protein [Bacteroidia bacterium]
GINVENDDVGGCSNPIIGVRSFLPRQVATSVQSIKVAGWFEADSDNSCCFNHEPLPNYAIYVPEGGGVVSIGFPTPLVCAPTNYIFGVNGSVVSSSNPFTVSDSSVKSDVRPLKNAIATIEKLNGVSYNLDKSMLRDSMMMGRHCGFLAQQVGRVIPEAVRNMGNLNGTSTKALSYNDIIPWLVEGMKEQQHMIDSLKSTLQNIQSCLNQICSASGNNSQGNNNNTTLPVQDVTLSNANAPLLYQNQPNPFSSNTKINYYLPEGTQGAIIVFYDNYGNQLKEVQLAQTGNATISLNPENLANGVYSYSMIINGKLIDTKRMILQK